jgi:signal transduction histidine kinase
MSEQEAQENNQLRLMAQQLARLVDVSVTINSTLNLDELLQYIIKTATEVLECDAASILLYDEKKSRLLFVAATGTDPRKLAPIPVPLDGSVAGKIFRENHPITLTDVRNDPRHFAAVSQTVNMDIRSLVGVPMHIRDKGIGVLEAINKRNGAFTDNDIDLLSVLASQAAVAIHNSRLVQALQKAYDELSETDRLKSNVIALASHELRTPLGIIIGYATFLQEEAQGELSEHAEQVLNAATQMRSLIESMTSLHLLQAKGLTLNPRPLPVQPILKEAYTKLQLRAVEKNQTVTFDLPLQSLIVTADQEKLLPVFANVLDNAIRFTPENGKIFVGARLEAGNVLVWVQDTGIGIPQGELSKIFQEFYQVEHHMTRQYGGLGIGLTIARGLLEMQGGRIWAESAGQGKGTVFKILLPPAGTSTLSLG